MIQSPAALGRRLAALLLLILGTACATPTPGPLLLDQDHPLAHRIWDTRAERFVDEAAVLAAAQAADIVLLGETHDNPVHHAVQARIYRELSVTRQAGLALEPFDRDRQAAIDAARAGGADAVHAAAQLARGWNWADYRDPVAQALSLDRPLHALNVSRDTLRGVVRGSWDAVPEAERTRLKIDAVWTTAREAYLHATILASHCNAVDDTLAAGLARAQRLRDAHMADALVNVPGPVAVLLGRGHARRDSAVPLYLAARAPETRVLTLALAEVEASKNTPADYLSPRVGDAPPFDYLWLTPRAERPDPCDAFKPASR